MATYIVLLGPPGAGKGTQAKLVTGRLGLPQVSTGDLFRAMKTQDTPLARKVQAIMSSGSLVPDDITVEMVKERLAQPDCRDGAILDGFPRTVPQAEALDRLLGDTFHAQVNVVPMFNLSEDLAVQRISGRRTCRVCGALYHVTANPPKREGVCDRDSGELFLREDDRPDTVRERYQVYLENTVPLIDYYRAKGLLEEIDAAQPVEAITADLMAAIRKHM
jgi:adenylate kinase